MDSWFYQLKEKLSLMDKKTWVWVLAIVVVVLLIVAIVLFWSFLDKGEKTQAGMVEESGAVEETSPTSENDPYKDINIDLPSSASPEELGGQSKPILLPTLWYEGVVKSYTDFSTFGELVFYIGGDESKEKSVHLLPQSVVFDADQNIVVVPSSIKDGVKAKFLVEGTIQQGNEVARVVILHPKDKLYYLVVKSLAQDGDIVVLEDQFSPWKYQVSANVEVKNALTGRVMELDLKSGDWIFVYGDILNNEGSVEDGYWVVKAERLYVFPKRN